MSTTSSRQRTTYLLDANILIQAYREYYAFDICPGFWDWLKHHCRADNIRSIDRVYEEIATGGDALSDWVDNAPESFFLSTAEMDTQNTFAEIIDWANSRNFMPAALATFADAADGWLVACAKVHGMTVVTSEKYHANRISSVKIPNVCEEFGVSYLGTFEMMRELGAELTWQTPQR